MTKPYRLPIVIIILLFLSSKGRNAAATARDTTNVLINDKEDGIRLHRQVSNLIGYMAGRDEVVQSLEYDNPVII